MSLSDAQFVQLDIGIVLEQKNYVVFFGNKKATLEKVQQHFPSLKFEKIRQIHSDTIVESSELLAEADAHYTSKENTALIIVTADCLPILSFCHQTGRIAAIHAGWKGVANHIVLKTLQKLVETGSSNKSFAFWIGPHIQQSSFETEFEVYTQIRQSVLGVLPEIYCCVDGNKYFLDLSQVIESQITTILGQKFQIWKSSVDTKTNLNHWSFRRDKSQAGRNISFIAKIKN